MVMKKEKSVRQREFKEAVVRQLKSLAAPVIITAVIAVAIVVIFKFQSATEQEPVVELNTYSGTEDPIVVENDRLKMTMDPNTTQFTLEVKDTGKVWYSNPPEAATDPLAVASYKGRLQSTLLLTFSQATGLQTTFDNFSYGIDNKLYEIEQGEDYIKINYSIGEAEKEYKIPPVTTEAKMKEWFDIVGKKDASFIRRYYKKYDINDLSEEDNKEELLANYPIIETEPIYLLRDTTTSGASTIKLEQIFEDAGYSAEDLEADKALNNKLKTSDKLVFNVSMTYRLDGGDLVVEMPLDDMQYRKSAPIYTMVMLPYFGAGGPEDEGYMLVPEGGGALINFNNDKQSQAAYYANMYGWDMALSRDAIVHDTRAYFNAFGIANGDDSFICILEEGVPYASVQADIADTGAAITM